MADHVPTTNQPAILVVTADTAQQRMYEDSLTRTCQVRVIPALNGQQALDAAARNELACALIDASLPDTDCIELAHLIRVQQHPETTPLVFIVNEDTRPDFLKRCYHLGAADLVMQRPNPQILVQKVQVYVQLFSRQQQLKSEVDTIKGRNEDLLQENREFQRVQKLLRLRATHDSLTGLPNRVLFSDRLSLAASRTRRSGRELAVLFLDLDDFKSINDRHGHAAGDAVLCTVGQRLISTLRTSDTIARLGGDEFGILLEGMTLDSIGKIAEKIRSAVCKPIVVDSALKERPVRVRVGASVGTAVLRPGETGLQDLINRADRMMYAAKEVGGGVRMDLTDRRIRADGKVRPLWERRGKSGTTPDGAASEQHAHMRPKKRRRHSR